MNPFRLFLVLLLILGCVCGCAAPAVQVPVSETESVPLFPDGDPDTAACKGSYSGTPEPDSIAALTEDTSLTMDALQVWYWSQAAQWQQSGIQPAPDFSLPLDQQACPVDDSICTWQQFFLKQALTAWHTTQALLHHSQVTALITEDAYQPDRTVLHKYMDGMPASEVLYGYKEYYTPNTMHQEYLDALPQTLQGLAREQGYPDTADMAKDAFCSSVEALTAFAQEWNQAYMYYTQLSYGLEAPERSGEASASPGDRVTFRHILLLPEEDTPEAMTACEEKATALLTQWSKDWKVSESTFAQLASQHSQDPGSAPNGGEYRNVSLDQLTPTLQQWCFDPMRTEGDTAILYGEAGVHIIYFCSRQTDASLQAQEAQTTGQLSQLLEQLRQAYPMKANYSDIVLAQGAGTISASQLLYPDICHERFPQVPLFLQQNYPRTLYGNYWITTNGCGITSMAMLASHLTDEEWTPPELCARYGSYSTPTGTAGSLFEDVPAQLGFYLLKKTYDWREARDYMKEGHVVIVVQYKGYWTRGGHYLVLEELSEDGLVRVRDSNMYNYAKLVNHKEDLFHWDTLTLAGMGYWVYARKVTATASCIRCGAPEKLEQTTVTGYTCPKCQTAQSRRNTYLCPESIQ